MKDDPKRPHHFELPTDRIATADQHGRRVYLYPTDVKGRYQARRRALQLVLIFVFLLLPWVRIGGHPAVLLDIPNRRFALFGVTFWAHDAPILLFIVAGAALTLGFFTTVWGRVWCGWACPQTVFTDAVFRKIERWVEGDALARRKLDEAPWDGEKIYRKGLKWSLFLVVTLVLTHSFLAYFVGTDEVFNMLRHSPLDSPMSFFVMLFATGAILFDFGWFREQFCNVLCPYGRFQSLLMDEDSLAVAYDEKRGEPRRGTGPGTGDCVNCYRCVQVCPNGVDIRRGVQLECIACTACIDACDDVMTRLGKPTGLIRYDSARGLKGEKTRFVRPRSLLYLALMALCAVGLALALHGRTPVEAAFVRATDSPYQEVNGQIINHFKVWIGNQTFEDEELRLIALPLHGAGTIELVMVPSPITVPAGEKTRLDLFVKFPKALLHSGKAEAEMEIFGKKQDRGDKPFFEEEVNLVGPYN